MIGKEFATFFNLLKVIGQNNTTEVIRAIQKYVSSEGGMGYPNKRMKEHKGGEGFLKKRTYIQINQGSYPTHESKFPDYSLTGCQKYPLFP